MAGLFYAWNFMGACAGLFAGKPAPTGISRHLRTMVSLWERVYPRRGRHCPYIPHG
ncbi:conserved protein of unknown function [Pseudomonas inefficax]|uniref:Uncharacterized protein n=1 Tax=Pseudomonas inefficax TaxID=2078786 RepID=A0AAQ1PCZ5_9PSED|nr:conserved protein of unknown function [Pseudomonas inefficax]